MKTFSLTQLFWVLLIGLIGSVLQGCKKDIDWDYEAKKELDNVMHDLYYWYDKVPNLDVNNYPSPVELMEALKVNPPDKWSYVTTKQEYAAYSAGIYYGFGFSSLFDDDGKLWIAYTFKTSPLTQKGIGRGWRIATIDGTIPTKDNFSQLMGENALGVTKTLGFISPEGATISYSFSKIEVQMNTVLFDSVYVLGGKKVAYMVLKGFIPPTLAELSTVFSKFKSKGADEIVVDLRYNGGGSIDVSAILASYIGGNIPNNSLYATYKYNSKNSYRDKPVNYTVQANALNVNKAIFITTNGTASASELVISGLKPYISVALIGSRTHGKPVGMPVLMYHEIDWVYCPISFSLRNADNEGDYFDGLAVNVEAADDYSLPFGDINEDSFAAALNYLGVLSKGVTSKSLKKSTLITGKGLYEEIGAW